MIRCIPPNTSTGRPRSRKSIITKIPLNLRLSSFGNIRRSETRNSESFGTKRKGKVAMHDYQKMGAKTLEKLLAKASELKDEMAIAIQVLPSDENQDKLEKLGLVIDRLKYQIEGRK